MSDFKENTVKLRELIQETSSQVNLRGILGITQYIPVYDSLLPVQKKRLIMITNEKHNQLLKKGYFISLAYVYPNGVVDNIGLIKNGVFDKKAWNIYAKWYTYLNNSLDNTSKQIADNFNGVPIKATSSGLASQMTLASQYYPMVVSHRVHAELSGIGWRGKNGLIVNPYYSCMIRLSGVVSSISLIETQKNLENCGICNSCFEACTFLKYQHKLEDYREQCMIYMNNLGLDDEVCGKCIKACIHSTKFAAYQGLPNNYPLNSVFYSLP
jgi:epoxyqueuosine reductase QueG